MKSRTSSIFLAAQFVMFALISGTPASAGIGNDQAPKSGTFLLNLGAEPPTLNPITSQDLYGQKVHSFIMESLLTRNEDTYAWEPFLAASWEISKDGTQYTFKLRPGVTWSDGQPLTAEDVKFSYDVIFDPKFQTAHLRPYYEGIEKVEIVDPQTVRFTAKDKYFKNFDSAATLTIVPKHVYGDADKGSTLNKTVVGSGAYLLDKNETGNRIVLKRNPKWWGASDPAQAGQNNFDQIVMRFVKDDTVSLEMLKKGEFDFDEFSPETYMEKAVGPEWGKKVLKLKVENSAPKEYGFVGWNFKSPLFQDKRVRLALYHLMNRREMIKKFRYDMSLPATGPWYQQSEYASKKIKAVEFDPKKALKLLKEAGWEDTDKDGVLDKVINGVKTPLKFTILYANPQTAKYLTMYKEDAKQAGVDFDVKQLEWNSFMKALNEKKFDAVTLGWGAGSVDVDPKQVWHSTSASEAGSNFISYNNPEVDKLIDEARQTMDKKKRLPLMQKVYELIAEDAPYAFMFNNKYILYGVQSRIGRPKDTFKYGVGSGYWWVKP